MSEPTPPHHVDWETPEEFAARPHAELEAPGDGRVRLPWTRVLALGVAAFAVWFLLYAPTLQHNAQVSPVGARRTVSLDVTGPVAAISRALQLSHFVSITGRSNGLSGGGTGTHGGGTARRGPAGQGRAGAHEGWHRAHDTDDGAPRPEGSHRRQPAARPDRRRLHRHRPG